VVELSTLLAGAAVAAGAVGWAEKRYRDMRNTLVELRVNQRWLIDHTGAVDGTDPEHVVGDGGPEVSDDD